MALRAVFAATLLLASVCHASQGLWIVGKALVAQQLLERSWQRAVSGVSLARPWPWADTWPVARVVVPHLGISRIVLAGAHGESLAFGPGLLDGSPAPGQGGNVVIAGHRDTQFRFLRRLGDGDLIKLEAAGGLVETYRVRSVRIVDSRIAAPVFDSPEPMLTLVSCFPFDASEPGGPWRYVVTATPLPGRDAPDPVSSS